jgi:hypothetical protein
VLLRFTHPGYAPLALQRCFAVRSAGSLVSPVWTEINDAVACGAALVTKRVALGFRGPTVGASFKWSMARLGHTTLWSQLPDGTGSKKAPSAALLA